MYIPNSEIIPLLCTIPVDIKGITTLLGHAYSLNAGAFAEIHWLNTPGPVYTTFTDNCGTGQPAAINNVSGDQDYHEVIFKQPVTISELGETLTAACCDPFDSYYFDGNNHWTVDTILQWWNNSNSRVNYITDRYKEELALPDHQPHANTWKIGNKLYTGQLYGPIRPVPENYKSWLDFYQNGMKDYLEWYILQIHQQQYMLPSFEYDWRRKEALDAAFLKR